ncbi:MAG: sulfotransferase family protein [Candidatus Binataceae bacterium]
MTETWPNFFIVGAAKAGTTSLYAYLRQHPRIFLPKVKEPQYFATVRPAPEYAHLVDAVTDRERYLRLFRKADHYAAVGEASPSYLWDPEAAARIKQSVPEARIIISLRDPIERAYSHYLMDYREGAQDLPFYEALCRDLARDEKGIGISYLYVELGQYAAQVSRYLEAFGPERVQILMFEDLRRETRKTVAQVARFLGLETAPVSAIDTSTVHNGYSVARARWARRLAGARWTRTLGQTVVPHSVGAFIFEKFMLKPAVKPPIDQDAVRLLRDIYEPDVRQLERTLGRSLPELRRSW